MSINIEDAQRAFKICYKSCVRRRKTANERRLTEHSGAFFYYHRMLNLELEESPRFIERGNVL
ncbi:hypothetical protein BFF98_05240 [Corynebacterium pseudotuberculosis]|nr:hypothetical protein ATN03_04470 [Corynebacterium pseudotuberculosis]ANZ91987.1 hypothetical protein CPMB20_05855 [Corynebacterium pseudotuberculosis]OMH77052.1 hypothetical protein BFF98_05240 [Corynebacterium pseudotuberculosis]